MPDLTNKENLRNLDLSDIDNSYENEEDDGSGDDDSGDDDSEDDGSEDEDDVSDVALTPPPVVNMSDTSSTSFNRSIEYAYKCNICGHKCRTLQILECHIAALHRNSHNTSTTSIQDELLMLEPIVEPNVDSIVKTIVENVVQPVVDLIVEPPIVNMLTCCQCGKSFVNKYNMEHHIKTHKETNNVELLLLEPVRSKRLLEDAFDLLENNKKTKVDLSTCGQCG